MLSGVFLYRECGNLPYNRHAREAFATTTTTIRAGESSPDFGVNEDCALTLRYGSKGRVGIAGYIPTFYRGVTLLESS